MPTWRGGRSRSRKQLRSMTSELRYAVLAEEGTNHAPPSLADLFRIIAILFARLCRRYRTRRHVARGLPCEQSSAVGTRPRQRRNSWCICRSRTRTGATTQRTPRIHATAESSSRDRGRNQRRRRHRVRGVCPGAGWNSRILANLHVGATVVHRTGQFPHPCGYRYRCTRTTHRRREERFRLPSILHAI